jgi:hypothetical protein
MATDMITVPNAFVSLQAAPNTRLTYAIQVNPAPLTVSVKGLDPVIGSVELLVTNDSGKALDVTSLVFTIEIGPSGNDLMQTTQGVKKTTSDNSAWTLSGPASVNEGPADFTLGPAVGDTVTLADSESIVAQIYDFETVTEPGTSTIQVAETIDNDPASFTSLAVTTFPAGFYFDGLLAAVESASTLLAVAQVGLNTPVTLLWRSSVADVSAITIYWSDARSGQQTAHPSMLGRWQSPPLTADTVFTVVVTARSDHGGEPLTAALTTVVSVLNPALIANELTVHGKSTLEGDAEVGHTLHVKADATVDHLLHAAGDAVVDHTLRVAGDTTLSGHVQAQGDLDAAGHIGAKALDVKGETQLGPLRVDGVALAGPPPARNTIKLGPWTFYLDQNNSLVISNGSNTEVVLGGGTLAVQKQRVICDLDPIAIYNRNRGSWLNATNQGDSSHPNNFHGWSFWMQPGDGDGNLQMRYGTFW